MFRWDWIEYGIAYIENNIQEAKREMNSRSDFQNRKEFIISKPKALTLPPDPASVEQDGNIDGTQMGLGGPDHLLSG